MPEARTHYSNSAVVAISYYGEVGHSNDERSKLRSIQWGKIHLVVRGLSAIKNKDRLKAAFALTVTNNFDCTRMNATRDLSMD